MNKYQSYSPPTMARDVMGASPASPGATTSPTQPRCAGCGGKIGSQVLTRVLRRLEQSPSPDVIAGLQTPDDAAVLKPSADRLLLATTDFFSTFAEDAYLVGRVAAQHALNDVWAMGGRPRGALCQATLPHSSETRQERLLEELLEGAVREFRPLGVALVGGHTAEGPLAAIGFTVLGDVPPAELLIKGGLRVGDALILTKPLGTGVLLAAAMQARCPAADWEMLVASLLASNQAAAERLAAWGVAAATDVSGFGLAGHLGEMLVASGVSAEISLGSIPVLAGAQGLAAAGLASTLAPANQAAASELVSAEPVVLRHPSWPLLFDPQTSGGLLIALPAARAKQVLAELRQHLPHAASIGQVVPVVAAPRLHVLP